MLKTDTQLLFRTLDTILKQAPTCLDALLTRADLYYTIDSLDSAIKDFESVRFRDTNNIYALYKLASCYQESDKYEMSLYYSKIAIYKKTNGSVLINYSDSLTELDRHLTKYDVSSAELMYTQAITYYYMRNLQSAYDGFNFCIQDKFRLDRCYLYRGSMFVESGQFEKACEDFHRANDLGNEQAIDYVKKYCK